MNTPWGRSQTRKTLGPGVVEVTTASHGGIHLDGTRNAQVHPAWRDKAGWYEEDCEWSIVAVTFPNLFTPDHVVYAHQVAKNWLPDQYEKALRTGLLPGESYKRREELFAASCRDRLVVTSAFGVDRRGRAPLPAGMVGVVARIGGRFSNAPGGVGERWFLVPADEYEQAPAFGFVVDPARHAEWPELARTA